MTDGDALKLRKPKGQILHEQDVVQAKHLWNTYNDQFKPKGVQAKKYFIAGAVSAMTFIRHMHTLMSKQELKKGTEENGKQNEAGTNKED